MPGSKDAADPHKLMVTSDTDNFRDVEDVDKSGVQMSDSDY